MNIFKVIVLLGSDIHTFTVGESCVKITLTLQGIDDLDSDLNIPRVEIECDDGVVISLNPDSCMIYYK